MAEMSDAQITAFRAHLDQHEAAIVDDLLTKAARCDGPDPHIAASRLASEILAMGSSPLGLAAAAAALALRLHRSRPTSKGGGAPAAPHPVWPQGGATDITHGDAAPNPGGVDS